MISKFMDSLPENIRAVMDAEHLRVTRDGYGVYTRSLKKILQACDIEYVKDQTGRHKVSKYNDWYLTGLAASGKMYYSLAKVRVPGDTQGSIGNSIPFVQLDVARLSKSIASGDEAGIFQVIEAASNPAPSNQCEAIRNYFASFNSEGSYLIADITVDKVLKKCFKDGVTTFAISNKLLLSDQWAQKALDKLAQKGVYSKTKNQIVIKNGEKLTLDEKCALLLISTGNASAHSYAGENLWHARVLGSNENNEVYVALRATLREHAIVSDAKAGSNRAEKIYERLFKDPNSQIHKTLAKHHASWYK